ncbi:hypothetical protein H3H54_10735 [Brachybacterium sp. Z12]|uniref:hypothetical protein n=1 Tax=Brachybacterium sp. Z12 TaxID=2759167 RepID=UPI00186272C4|nr:hypothetical protein [Brachybacterium sp. Z12]QNN81837.1 hypothetical protein H3H54_10735 [Brachybacterium sp. Z12]
MGTGKEESSSPPAPSSARCIQPAWTAPGTCGTMLTATAGAPATWSWSVVSVAVAPALTWTVRGSPAEPSAATGITVTSESAVPARVSTPPSPAGSALIP